MCSNVCFVYSLLPIYPLKKSLIKKRMSVSSDVLSTGIPDGKWLTFLA